MCYLLCFFIVLVHHIYQGPHFRLGYRDHYKWYKKCVITAIMWTRSTWVHGGWRQKWFPNNIADVKLNLYYIPNLIAKYIFNNLNFAVSTVPADFLALGGARTSSDTEITKYFSDHWRVHEIAFNYSVFIIIIVWIEFLFKWPRVDTVPKGLWVMGAWHIATFTTMVIKTWKGVYFEYISLKIPQEL